MPSRLSSTANDPIDGLNRNSQSMPAMAGATA